MLSNAEKRMVDKLLRLEKSGPIECKKEFEFLRKQIDFYHNLHDYDLDDAATLTLNVNKLNEYSITLKIMTVDGDQTIIEREFNYIDDSVYQDITKYFNAITGNLK